MEIWIKEWLKSDEYIYVQIKENGVEKDY